MQAACVHMGLKYTINVAPKEIWRDAYHQINCL